MVFANITINFHAFKQAEDFESIRFSFLTASDNNKDFIFQLNKKINTKIMKLKENNCD